MAVYRSRFQPSPDLASPYAILAVTVICGTDDAHAARLAAPVRLAIARSRTGQQLPVATVEEALAHRFTPDEEAAADVFLEGAVVGGPARVRDGLQTLVARTGADEVILSTLVPDLDDRLASLARTASAVGTSPGPD